MQIAEIQYNKEKQRVQLKIPRICDKRRTQLKSAPDYYVANDLVDTKEYFELFHINEDSDEISYDSDDSYDSSYDSDEESTISEEESDWEESDESEDSDSEFEIP